MDRDALSTILNAIKVSASGIGFFEFRAPWAIAIERPHPLIVTVTEGSLWLNQGALPARKFLAGDSFILPRGFDGTPLVVSSSPSVQRPVSSSVLEQRGHIQPFDPDRPDIAIRRLSWGSDNGPITRQRSFAFEWQDTQLTPTIAALPYVLPLPADKMDGLAKDLFRNLDINGMAVAEPGFEALLAQLAQLFLVQALRSVALQGGYAETGWLAALADPNISRAIRAIHEAPGRKWSVETLAHEAHLSRSVFARRFLDVVGQTPMAYLRRWRIHLSCEQLLRGKTTIASLSHGLGYQSEAAFRTAFVQETGMTPREFAAQPRPSLQ